MLIRVSSGTEAQLGLKPSQLDVKPTTAYLLTYHNGRCRANCAFCTQARESKSSIDLLSRVVWPPHPLDEVADRLKMVEKSGELRRVCIQTINYDGMFKDLLAIIEHIKANVSLPISVSCHPLNEANIRILAEMGVDRLAIPLDAASEEVFDRVKGRGVAGFYTRRDCLKALKIALKYFGPRRVLSYIMVGLGEKESEAVKAIQELVDLGVSCSLFAFTPVRGIILENNPPPSLESYRRIQLAHYLIEEGISRFEWMNFSEDGVIENFGVDKSELVKIVLSGKPFMTRGCPDCNRPYFNEKPGSSIYYNYPRPLRPEETREVLKLLKLL